MKKSSKIIVILLVLILIAILGLGGYVIYDLNNRVEEQANTINELQANDDKTGDVLEENEVSVNNSNNTANTNNASTSSSSKKAEDYITMSEYEIEGDEYTEARTIEYPEININSSDVEEINSEIYDELNLVQELDYEVYLNNDILSLVINIISTQNDNQKIIISNINIDTGEYIENSEILEQKNISLSEIKSQLIENIDEESYIEIFGEEFYEWYGKEGVEEFLNDDIEYINSMFHQYEGEVFLNNENELCVKFLRTTGTGSIYRILNIDQNKDITDEIF